MMPRKEDFWKELDAILLEARRLGISIAGVKAGDLHRRVGAYPGADHRMPVCCAVMRAAMREDDEILEAPPKGNGASLLVLYRISGR